MTEIDDRDLSEVIDDVQRMLTDAIGGLEQNLSASVKDNKTESDDESINQREESIAENQSKVDKSEHHTDNSFMIE